MRIAIIPSALLSFVLASAHAGMVLEPPPDDSGLLLEMGRAVYGKNYKLPCRPKAGTGAPNPPIPAVPTDARYFEDADSLQPLSPFGHNFPPEHFGPDRKAFCSRTSERIMSSLDTRDNAMNMYNFFAFKNPSGDFNTGLCWLHSRFQRSAHYLLNFIPGSSPKDRPTKEEALQIIRSIGHGHDRVWPIKGFANFQEFSEFYQADIERELNSMAYDSLGDLLSRVGDGAKTPAEMKHDMDQLFETVTAPVEQSDGTFVDPGIPFLKLRIIDDQAGTKKDKSFVSSHSWLVTKMTPIQKAGSPGNPLSATGRDGYQLHLVDSNHPQVTFDIAYKYGQTTLDLPTGFKVAPNLFWQGDIADFHNAIRGYCK